MQAWQTMRTKMIAVCDKEELKNLALEIFEAQEKWEYDYTVSGIIAKEIIPTTMKSLCRFGDRNRITKSCILQYVVSEGSPLDCQAAGMTELYGKEIQPDEIAEFMMENDRGVSSYYPLSCIYELKQIWKQLTGFNFCGKFAMENIINDVI